MKKTKDKDLVEKFRESSGRELDARLVNMPGKGSMKKLKQSMTQVTPGGWETKEK